MLSREIETNQASISFAEKAIAEIIQTITAVLKTGSPKKDSKAEKTIYPYFQSTY